MTTQAMPHGLLHAGTSFSTQPVYTNDYMAVVFRD